MQFYPGDWQRDTGLKLCSLAARGLWAEMMWLMFDGEPFGHLSVKGSVIPPVKLAGIVGAELSVVEDLLAELERYDVFSRTPKGIIFSRRMVRDAKRRETNALNGGKGGNPHLTGKKTRLSKSVNQKDNREVIPLTADAVAEENTSGKERAGEPMPFTSTEFTQAWADFMEMRTKIRKPMTLAGKKLILDKLIAMGEPRAIASLHASIMNSWQGVFEPKEGSATAKMKATIMDRENPGPGLREFMANKAKGNAA